MSVTTLTVSDLAGIRIRNVFPCLVHDLSLPPATKLGQGNIFRSVCQQFCPGRGGMRGCLGGHAWFYSGGMCGFIRGGVRGFIRGRHAWFYLGGMRGFILGVCMVLFGGCAWFYLGRGHAWFYLGGWACMVLFGGACVVLFGGACVVLFGGAYMVLFGGACMVLFRGACVVLFSGGACVVFSVFLDTMRYGQWAGGTHPTGMHSCFVSVTRDHRFLGLWKFR